MTDLDQPGEDLDLLPRTEKELVVRVGDPHAAGLDSEFLMLARLRLRNIVEKYSGELKRARLARQPGHSERTVRELQKKLELCSRALERCDRQLTARDATPDDLS